MSSKRTTPAEEEYLEAIYRLSQKATPVSLGDLAQWLEISPVSTNEMVRRMADVGLVTYRPYVGAELTVDGRERAETILRRHRLWECLLSDVMGVPWHLVHAEACRLEHATSDLVESHLAAFLEDPNTCPHGHPLPGALERPSHALPLTDLDPGQSATVVTVLDEEEGFLYALDQAGLRPGAEVTLLSAQGSLGIVTVRSMDRPVAMSQEMARKVLVSRCQGKGAQ